MNIIKFSYGILLMAFFCHPAHADEFIGDWSITSDVDPINDKSSFNATAKGDAGSILITCYQEKYVNIFVNSENFLGSSTKGRRVEYRVDDNPPESQIGWEYFSDFVSGNSAYFARDIADGKMIVIRVRDFRGVSHLISAKIDGARETINRIYGLCGKKSPLVTK